MNIFLLIIKLLLVIIFLMMFVRRPSWAWGMGLLSVTTAVLLDTLLGTLGAEQTRAELGFFYFVFAGVVFGGAALWLFGLFRPNLSAVGQVLEGGTPMIVSQRMSRARKAAKKSNHTAVFDQNMLYQQMQERFGRSDLQNLMFDLEINENDVLPLNQDPNQLIKNIMQHAEENGKTAALALGIERILTPPPADHLPRLEKISADSPPTILRQYLVAHYTLAQLRTISRALHIDWENLGVGSKPDMARQLLLYLARRNRIAELVKLMQAETQPES